jgi:adenylate cyclase
MERHLGENFIVDFFFSKYQKPINEDRIIMFLDLKDSTTIAEEIGNKKFVEFVNLCYLVMAHPIIRNKAEILKYVGDEVIITWPIQKGLKNSKCISFYFDYHTLLETYRDEFESKFGFFPVFKAGVHSGEVTAAFLGTLRKQKDYSGDVMNTTARIESICNDYNADLLVSANLLKQLPKDRRFKYIKIGNLELKGKTQKVEIMKVERV